jgi:gliding motility-associated-like protein
MIRFALVVLLLSSLVTFTGLAQPYTSKVGRFQVDQIRGCAPLTVTISMNPNFDCYPNDAVFTPCKCDPDNPCDMNFGEGNGFQNLTFSHTYTQPGTYTLTVLVQSEIDDIVITVLPNTPPQFDVFACANNEVSVIIPDLTYNRYYVNFNDGSAVIGPLNRSSIGVKVNHVYATPGPKNVTVQGEIDNAAPNCNPGTKPITAVSTLPTPVINRLEVLDPSSIQLEFNGQQGIQYRIEIAQNNGTNFQLLRTVNGVTTEVISNLRPDDSYYCFRIGAFDPCANQTTYSNIICSANVDAAAQNNVNNVSWITNTSGVSNFRVGKTWNAGGQTITDNASPYADTEITCNTEYCYVITTNYPNGSQSISLSKCVVAFSTDIPDPITDISATVTDPGVTLDWQIPADFVPTLFSVFRVSGGSSSLVNTTNTATLNDQTYTTTSPFCYRVSYVDACGNQSPPSADACPISLSGSLNANNSIQLNWTAYSGWSNAPQQYVVEQYASNGQLLQTFDAGTSTSLLDESEDLDEQTLIYIVRAIPTDNAITPSVSNRIVIIKNPNLFYPTAFTPDGDNLNDQFNVFGQYITEFEMNIFNRWGELMFSTQALDEGWDGTYRGKEMPEGTYTFVALITDREGRTFKKSGTVVLLKKGN